MRTRGGLALACVLGFSLSLVASADAFVYWAHGDPIAIGRASLDGSHVDQMFITAPSCGVAVDDAHVYWGTGEAGTIGRANLDGSNVDQSFIAGGSPCGPAVDGAHIYWFTHNTIGRANLDGSEVDQSFIHTKDQPCGGVAVDGSHIYWTNGALPNDTIGRADLDGSNVDLSFIPGGYYPCGVAVDARHLCWAGGDGDDSLARANLDGTMVDPTCIVGARVPCGVAVDRGHIYWANHYFANSREGIGRAKLNGTGVNQDFILGAVGSEPCGVAVDSAFDLRKAKRHKGKGTATLPVDVPGKGRLELDGRGIRKATKDTHRAGKVKLAVKPKGEAKKNLRQKGKG